MLFNLISKRVVVTINLKQLFKTICTTCIVRDDITLQVLTPKVRVNENVKDLRARLLYQSRKRGMLENGLILSTFASKYLSTFDEKQLKLYDHLINTPSNDWDIFYWATGVKETPAGYSSSIMELLKSHVKNEERERRFVQPEIS
ncbi:SDHAF2 (predicted) [Pycnogonum litorale]